MACCAFAVLVLSQLLAPFVWARRRLFGARARTNAAVAWSLTGTPVASDVVPRRVAPRTRALLYAAAAFELAIGAAAVAYVAPSRGDAAWIEAAALDGPWCRGIANLLGSTSDGIRSE